MGRTFKLLPRLKQIVSMLRRHEEASMGMLMNSFKSMKHLQNLETKADLILKESAGIKSLLEDKSEVILKAIREGKKPSDFREIVDRAGDTTLLKVINVTMAYRGAFATLGCVGWCLVDLHPESRAIAELGRQKLEGLAREMDELSVRFVERSMVDRQEVDWP